jgi:hypothetical protein
MRRPFFSEPISARLLKIFCARGDQTASVAGIHHSPNNPVSRRTI